MNGNSRYERKSQLVFEVECKCPLCKKTFKKKLFWTGNSKPYIYCEKCKSMSEQHSENDFFVSNNGRMKPSMITSF